TRVMAVRTFIGPLGGITTVWLFAITELPIFADSIQGARWTAIGVGVATMAVGVIPALFVKERIVKSRQPGLPVLKGLATTLRCRPFLALVFMATCTIMGVFTVYSLGLYLNIYYVHGGDRAVASVFHGWVGTANQLAMLVAIPVVTLLATRFGKRET